MTASNSPSPPHDSDADRAQGETALRRIVSFERVGVYALRLLFDDGRERTIDFEPFLRGPIFGELRDPTRFGEVQLDPDFGALTWPNGADIAPMALYDWPASGSS